MGSEGAGERRGCPGGGSRAGGRPARGQVWAATQATLGWQPMPQLLTAARHFLARGSRWKMPSRGLTSARTCRAAADMRRIQGVRPGGRQPLRSACRSSAQPARRAAVLALSSRARPCTHVGRLVAVLVHPPVPDHAVCPGCIVAQHLAPAGGRVLLGAKHRAVGVGCAAGRGGREGEGSGELGCQQGKGRRRHGAAHMHHPALQPPMSHRMQGGAPAHRAHPRACCRRPAPP